MPGPFTVALTAPRAVVANECDHLAARPLHGQPPRVTGCTVTATDRAGRTVGTGEVSADGSVRSVVVSVALNRTALRRAGLATRVLPVTLTARATASDTRESQSDRRSVLVVPPVVRAGFTASTGELTTASRAALVSIAKTLGAPRPSNAPAS